MTENVRGLVGKWRSKDCESVGAGEYSEGYNAATLQCADELSLTLAQQPAGEAVAWQVRPKSMGGHWFGWCQQPTEEAAKELMRRYERDGVTAEYRALYTTPADSAPLVEALVIIAGGGLTSPSLAKIAQDALAAHRGAK